MVLDRSTDPAGNPRLHLYDTAESPVKREVRLGRQTERTATPRPFRYFTRYDVLLTRACAGRRIHSA